MFRLQLEVQLSLNETAYNNKISHRVEQGVFEEVFKNPSAQMRKKGQLVVSHMEIRYENYGGCMSFYMDQVLKLEQ